MSQIIILSTNYYIAYSPQIAGSWKLSRLFVKTKAKTSTAKTKTN